MNTVCDRVVISLTTPRAEVTRRELAVSAEAGPWADTELSLEGPVDVTFEARRTERSGVHVVGDMRARLSVACRRCLSPMSVSVHVPLDVLFEPGVQVSDEDAYPLDVGASELDLGPWLREELLLAAPSYPLCSPDCKGICPRCGADLSEGPCGCLVESRDPRWDALRELSEN